MVKFTLTSLLVALVSLVSAAVVQDTYALEYYGKYSEALVIAEKLAAENSKEYFFQLRAGWLAYLSTQYTKSLGFYQNALILQPESIEARTGQLYPLMALGRYKQTEIAGLAILRSDPKNYTVRLKLAYALFLVGEFGKSEKYYADLSTDYPSDATVLMGLGWAMLKQGKKAVAKAAFQRVKLMFPENKYADEGLGWADK